MRRLLLIGVLFLALVPSASAMRWLDDPDTTPPVLTVPGPISVETEDTGGTVVTYTEPTATDDVDPAPTVSCSKHSGDPFPVGTTTVTCTAQDASGNTTPGSFDVTVTLVDHTKPVVTAPGISVDTEDPAGAVVHYPVSATDNLDPDPAIVCDHPNDALFPLGTTSVSCTAHDASGNTSDPAAFNVIVTLVDHTNPVVTVPGSFSVDTETDGPAAVAFPSAPSATDNLDGPLSVTCDHSSGDLFPIGTTTVHCHATDSHTNTGNAQFDVTVVLVDHTNPVVTVPDSFSVETETNAPTAVAFPSAASATDNLDGPLSVVCDHNSGDPFPIGSTTVHCQATDSHSNTGNAQFDVTVVLVDHTAPVLHGVPSTLTREADGPLGSIVTWTPSAIDAVDGPLLVTCLPAPGTKFSLGTTNVTCTATDSANNKRTESFPVKVVDTTEPVLTVPDDLLVSATTEAGIPKSNATVSAFLAGATATDIVDETLTIGNNAPELFPVGATIVTFSTTDDSGNTAKATAALVVFPPGDTPPPPLPGGGGVKDRTPPDDVKNLAARPGSRKITLSWTKPAAADFDHVTITRTLIDGTAGTVVYTGRGTSHVDSSVQNGVEYRYTVVSFDASGNRSAGAVVAATPGQPLLLTPRDGARVKRTKTIRLSWARVKDADYYNVQLYLVTGLSARSAGPAKSQAETKVLSVWPKKTRFVLKKRWKFAGIRRQLRPGVYHWYVWPGFGNRKAVNYGPLMGSSTIVVVR